MRCEENFGDLPSLCYLLFQLDPFCFPLLPNSSLATSLVAAATYLRCASVGLRPHAVSLKPHHPTTNRRRSPDNQKPALRCSASAMLAASGSKPRLRASTNTPTNPTTRTPSPRAVRRPSFSSMTSKSAGNSRAKTIASASPAPRSRRKSSTADRSPTSCRRIQPDAITSRVPALSKPATTTSDHTADGTTISPNISLNNSSRSIRARAINGDESTTTLTLTGAMQKSRRPRQHHRDRNAEEASVSPFASGNQRPTTRQALLLCPAKAFGGQTKPALIPAWRRQPSGERPQATLPAVPKCSSQP